MLALLAYSYYVKKPNDVPVLLETRIGILDNRCKVSSVSVQKVSYTVFECPDQQVVVK